MTQFLVFLDIDFLAKKKANKTITLTQIEMNESFRMNRKIFSAIFCQ